MKEQNNYLVIIFYKYVTIDSPHFVMDRERAVCEVLDLKGRMIIANEGINSTLEGTKENIEKYKEHIRKDKRFKIMDIKESVGNGNAFPRLSIKVKDEIVSTKLPPHIDPRKKTARHLNPAELKKMYQDKQDFVILDMRNDYELHSGYFEKTVNIGLKNSRDLQDKIESLKVYKDKNIVTVCTYGVRCEKMSAYLLDQGFANVSQLHGGVGKYMERYPGENYLGTLYTFDQRVTIDFGGDSEGKRVVVGKCIDCDAHSEVYYDIYDERGKDKHVILCTDCSISRGVQQHASKKEILI